jgi:hypothetical protein
MVKITYDLNNAEEVKLVEDYFWYKYFVKSFKFDWGEYLKDYYKITYQEKLNKHEIVKQHFNKYELKIAIDIHKRIYGKNMHKHINFNYLISDIITFNSTKKLKHKLIEKLNNTSGYRGVRLEHNKWRAQIRIDGKNKHLGYYDSIEDAIIARYNKAKEIQGEFINECEKIQYDTALLKKQKQQELKEIEELEKELNEIMNK